MNNKTSEARVYQEKTNGEKERIPSIYAKGEYIKKKKKKTETLLWPFKVFPKEPFRGGPQ